MDGIAVLRFATLAYAAILVLALAATLITIAVYLWRIAAALGSVRQALIEVRDRTMPLKQHLGGLEQLTEERVHEFESATIAIERSVDIYNQADVVTEEAGKL
jgi:hypothetical protein